MKFTVEIPNNESLPILDSLVTWYQSDPPQIKIYRKPATNPSYIHWYSFHDLSIKKAILSNQFFRAFKICDPPYLNEEINKIKDIFKRLKYHIHIINFTFKKAKEKFLKENIGCTNKYDFNILPVPNIKKNEAYNSLPKNLPTVTTNIIILKNVLKPHTNELDKNAGICKINCQNCNSVYIGETNDLKKEFTSIYI